MNERVHGLFKKRGIVRILPLVLQELKIEGQIPFKNSREEESCIMGEKFLSKIYFIAILLNCDSLESECEEYEIPLQFYIQAKQISKFALQSRFQANASWEPMKGGLYSSKSYRDDERIDPPWIDGENRENNNRLKCELKTIM